MKGLYPTQQRPYNAVISNFSSSITILSLFYCDLVLVLCSYNNRINLECKLYNLLFGENILLVFKGFLFFLKNSIDLGI